MSLKILIRGLPIDFDEEELLELSEEFGDVTACAFMSDTRTGRRAWVEYSEQWEAEVALGELDGAAIEDSYLTVSVFDAEADNEDEDDDEGFNDGYDDEDDFDDDEEDDFDDDAELNDADDDWDYEEAAEEEY